MSTTFPEGSGEVTDRHKILNFQELKIPRYYSWRRGEQGNSFCAFPCLGWGWGSDRLNSSCFLGATWKVPLKSWHEIHVSQVYCVLLSCGVGHHTRTFLRKRGQDDEQPEPLLFNHEADHDPADHKTGALISHGVVEGALSRDH